MVIYGSRDKAALVICEMRATGPFGEGLKRLDLGRSGEDMAVGFLEGKGFSILERNYRCLFGEIDVIAGKGDTIAFVEVKTRSGVRYGRPCEAVGRDKQAHIRRVALFYIGESRKLGLNLYDKEFRFDIVEILSRGDGHKINYIRDAF